MITITNVANFQNSLQMARVCVLLVDLSGYDSRIASYKYQVTAHSWQSFAFSSDFGVPNNIFGNALTGNNCVSGITVYWDQPYLGNFHLFYEVISGQVTGLAYGSLCTYGT